MVKRAVIKALIFDFDGVIIDTESAEFLSWQELYASHDCVLELDVWAKVIGVRGGTYDMYAELALTSGRELDVDGLRLIRRKRNFELIEMLSVMPGVLEWIAAARALGLKLGLASSSTVEWVVGHLTRVGLQDAFDCIVCADHVENTKPHPELYLAACAALGVSPDAAIAIEDSPNGIAAAKAAGIYCFAVPNALTAQLDVSAADMRLESLADASLTDLVLTLSG